MSSFKDYAKDFGSKHTATIIWFALGVCVGVLGF
jgi:hypothetical protein